MYAEELSSICGLDISQHAASMFAAKADISDLTAADVVLSDSKVYDVNGRRLRVSVHETTSAAQAITRTEEYREAMTTICESEGLDHVSMCMVAVDMRCVSFCVLTSLSLAQPLILCHTLFHQVLFFVVDILNEEATFVGATDAACELVSGAFHTEVDAQGMAVLPGVLSRKKQIIPALERASE